MDKEKEKSGRLSLEEAAEYCGLPPGSMYSQVRYMRIGSFKLGKRIVFDRKDLDEFLRKNYRPAKA